MYSFSLSLSALPIIIPSLVILFVRFDRYSWRNFAFVIGTNYVCITHVHPISLSICFASFVCVCSPPLRFIFICSVGHSFIHSFFLSFIHSFFHSFFLSFFLYLTFSFFTLHIFVLSFCLFVWLSFAILHSFLASVFPLLLLFNPVGMGDDVIMVHPSRSAYSIHTSSPFKRALMLCSGSGLGNSKCNVCCLSHWSYTFVVSVLSRSLHILTDFMKGCRKRQFFKIWLNATGRMWSPRSWTISEWQDKTTDSDEVYFNTKHDCTVYTQVEIS